MEQIKSDVGEMSCSLEDEYDGEWEEVQDFGNSRGKGGTNNKGKGKGPSKSAGKGQPGKQRSQEDSEDFPYKRQNCGEEGRKVAQYPTEGAKCRGNNGVGRAEDEEDEDAGVQANQDLGDVELRAVGGVSGVSAW